MTSIPAFWLGLWRCIEILAGIALLGGALEWYGECHPDAVDKQIKSTFFKRRKHPHERNAQ